MSAPKWYRVRNLGQLGPNPDGPEYSNEIDGSLGPKYDSLEHAKRHAIAENKATGDKNCVIVEDEQGNEIYRPDSASQDEALA
jgi:hypothetical protein